MDTPPVKTQHARCVCCAGGACCDDAEPCAACVILRLISALGMPQYTKLRQLHCATDTAALAQRRPKRSRSPVGNRYPPAGSRGQGCACVPSIRWSNGTQAGWLAPACGQKHVGTLLDGPVKRRLHYLTGRAERERRGSFPACSVLGNRSRECRGKESAGARLYIRHTLTPSLHAGIVHGSGGPQVRRCTVQIVFNLGPG